MIVGRAFLACLSIAAVIGQATSAANYDGVLTIKVAQEGTGEPLPVRMELRKSGRPVRVRPDQAVAVDSYLVFEGAVTLELKKGHYEFFIDAGPEFQTREGHFEIERHAEDETEVLITRRVNMRGEGWWAGDLDVSQRFDDMPLLMRAAGLDFVPVTAAENFKGKCKEFKQRAGTTLSDVSPPFFGPWTVIDNRQGGGLIYVGGDARPDVCKLTADKSTLPALNATSEKATQAIALSPYAWYLPIWIASGKLDAVEIIHRNALTDKSIGKETDGYPRDKKFYPGPMGNGRWSEAIYHHLLNCGIRIPPAAGSGSGSNGNPVGTNRVYAYCGEQCSPDGWLAALKAGQVVVTNGPLLRTTVDGYPPGHVFPLSSSEWREFQIALSLTYYEKAAVEYLEIIKNGEVAYQVRLKELAQNKGQLPFLKFDASGWFAVRAMTGNTKNYQYATTAPYYVELEGRQRISRRSVQFFLDWLDAAKEEFEDNQTVLNDISVARGFWEELHLNANAQ